MIVRKEDGQGTWLDHVSRHQNETAKSAAAWPVLRREELALLIQKEIARCERRPHFREFAMLLVDFGNDRPQTSDLTAFLIALRRRLRITDEIGVWRETLSVFLPETGREGAKHVANAALELGRQAGLEFDTDIQVFPWDDHVAGKSDELNSETQSNVDDRKLSSDRISAGEMAETEGAPARVFSGNAFEMIESVPTPIWKRMMDLVGATTGLILLSPLLAAAAIAIRWDSRGPVLFIQNREGKDGRTFRIFKFRTMRKDAERNQSQLRSLSEQDGPAFKFENDPRVTKIGRYLRKSCIDELPQLFNVLRGEMSLVGPRPLPVGESLAAKTWQRRRLQVLPGMTCTWQIEGGRDVPFDQWMRMDLDYIKQRSVLVDLKLLFRTFKVVISHRGSV